LGDEFIVFYCLALANAETFLYSMTTRHEM
jgi:hypothetical protein